MNRELLLAHFNRICEAPGAIQHLRTFIFDLAVRGKLVEQDPNDEPAIEILKRIQSRRIQTVKRGTTKKPTLPVEPNDFPFSIPSGWQFTRIGTICDLENGDRSKNYPSRDEFVASGIPFINAGHLESGGISLTSMNYIPESRFNLLKSGKVRNGDILFCLRGSLGKSALVSNISRGAIASSLVIIRLMSHINPHFALEYLFSSLAVEMIRCYDNGTAQPNLSSVDLGKFIFPLPPLAEQDRIVAKVGELMALCDRLEAQQCERETRRDRLAVASYRHLDSGTDKAEFRKHAHFYIQHLPTITTRPEQIADVRRAIIGIAIRGELVPQDPTDEPAFELLNRIQARKALLVKERKVRSPAPTAPIPENMVPFRVPPDWLWVRFGELIEEADAGWSPKSEDFPKSGDSWGVLRVSAVSWDRFLPEENKQLYPGVVPPISAQVHAGNFLISRANTSELVAKSVVVEEEPQNLILSDKIVRLRTSEDCDKKFLSMVNNHAPYARAYYAEEASGTSFSMKNVSRAVIYGLAIPLPPLAEQQRIMAKVNQLMAVCDRLEAMLTTAQAETRRLLKAVLHHALNDACKLSTNCEMAIHA